MIILTEERIGVAPDEVIAWGLLVCGGVLCRLADGRVAGAHFTPADHPDEMQAGLRAIHTRLVPPSEVIMTYLVLPIEAWRGTTGRDFRSGLPGLLTMIRRELAYNYPVWVADAARVPGQGFAVDVMLQRLPAFPMRPFDYILHRRRGNSPPITTPNPQPAQSTTLAIRRRDATGQVLITQTPSDTSENVAGFTPFSPLLFDPM